MSFDIDWAKLVSEESITTKLREFFDEQLNAVSLPSYINDLAVTDFSLGQIPPDVIIRHIGDPFDEFYSADPSDDEERRELTTQDRTSDANADESSTDEESEPLTHQTGLAGSLSFGGTAKDTKVHDSKKMFHNYSMNNLGIGPHERETPPTFFPQRSYRTGSNSIHKIEGAKSEDTDMQLVIELAYCGDIMLEVSVCLLLNYPSSHFISLPIKLRITKLEIHCLAVAAFVRNSICFSLLCDLNDMEPELSSTTGKHTTFCEAGSKVSPNSQTGGNFVDYNTNINKERIDVIRSVKIDTEIGEAENTVLRNVGKVEKFLVEQLREIIRDELCWPSWICVELGEQEMTPAA